jgi:hypothetical protein
VQDAMPRCTRVSTMQDTIEPSFKGTTVNDPPEIKGSTNPRCSTSLRHRSVYYTRANSATSIQSIQPIHASNYCSVWEPHAFPTTAKLCSWPFSLFRFRFHFLNTKRSFNFLKKYNLKLVCDC